MKRWNLILAVLIANAGAFAQTYPQELYPSNAAINALNGQVDSLTGLEYVPQGTNPSSTIPLPIRLNRMFNRLYGTLGTWNRGRVVQTATLRIGVFPITYTMNGARVSYAGATDQGNGSLTLGNDTYYIYLDNANALQIVTDGTGWPADITQYLPLAEVVVSGGAITAIVDRRTWSAFFIPQTGGAATTGTDSTYFVLDQDNGSSGADVELRANRGSTGNDAALRFTGSTGAAAFYSDRDANTLAPLSSLTYTSTVSTGTAPLTVSSTTKVSNLNADATDGVSIGSPVTNGLAYGSSTSLLGFTSAPTAADVLYADGSGVPTWGALGATSGVQAYDADLAGLAAVSSNGIIVRTSGGTFSPRVINAAGAISVSNGNGVSGNPVVGITGQTDSAVLLGDSSNGLKSGPVGTDNTVLVGRTSLDPTFRKLVNADLDTSAAVSLSKLATGTPGNIIVADGSGIPTYRAASGDVAISSSGEITDSYAPTFTNLGEGDCGANCSTIVVTLKKGSGASMDRASVATVWLSDVAGEGFTGTAPDSVATSCSNCFQLQVLSADKAWVQVFGPTGAVQWEIEKSGSQTYYLNVVVRDRIYSSPAIVFVP